MQKPVPVVTPVRQGWALGCGLKDRLDFASGAPVTSMAANALSSMLGGFVIPSPPERN
jgi:hypothetical protein